MNVLQIHAALRTIGAQISAEHFADLRVGEYLQRHRQIGRIEGFSLEFRATRSADAMHILRLGAGLQVEPIVLLRVACRLGGRMAWANAPQRHSDLGLREWRRADPALLKETLEAISAGAALRTAASFTTYVDPELTPEKGR